MTDQILKWLEEKHDIWAKALKNVTPLYMRDAVLVRLMYLDEFIGVRQTELENEKAEAAGRINED